MYYLSDCLSRTFYVPGRIANLPTRRRWTEYRHAGHTRDDIRRFHPWSVELTGPDGQSAFDFEVSESELHKDFKLIDRERMVSHDDHS